ncbi:hypothetical protein GYB22_10975 [bacterium]|nr:hypothetical protein [bacterium]
MKTNFKTTAATLAVAAVIFNFSSCKYPEGPNFTLKSKTSRLTGEWQVMEIDGEDAEDFEYFLEFDKGGEGTVSAFGYDEDFEWEWIDDKRGIEIDSDGDKTEFEIQKLTNDEMIFEDEEKTEWLLEKQ